jgi:carbon starvation protein
VQVGWLVLAVLGAGAYATLAVHRGESLNSAYILIAAFCSYAIGYRFYSKWLAARVLALNDRRATPCEVHDDGKDFVKTNRWIVFGHHFAAISGPGPLVGPVLAAQFGYLPGTLWILIGAVLGGAVQDFVILFCSVRRDGKSLAQMVREELNTTGGVIGVLAILSIMVILLAVLALVVVKALAESPWGVFTVGATIPIAMFMGGYLRFWRIGRVLEVSVLGAGLLLLAVWGGQYVHGHESWARAFALSDENLAWVIIGYGFAASVLPVWLLLAPRDYLSTFMKLGTIFALAVGVFLVLPDLQMPALSKFVDGSGLIVPGQLFPFCFITIACGAISGFHTLISSGITPKIITRESYTRSVGYGAMCLESLVAIMAMIAACTLEPGVYFAMNVGDPNPDLQARAAAITAKVQAAGVPVVPEEMQHLAEAVKEKTLYGRTGGAATLAVGMARIFSTVTHGRWLDLWYHFAIMFEALFILTTLDAGTRVGRYLLQDALGNVWKPLGDVRRLRANFLASGLMVSAWGFFLIQGVRDPDGGVKALWPLFGIANQMLAAIALCLATTIILKMQLQDPKPGAGGASPRPGRPALALVTLVPLVWLLTVTLTAGYQKIFHAQARRDFPRVGFLQVARELDAGLPRLEQALAAAEAAGNPQAIAAARQAVRNNRMQHFNHRVDALAAGVYLVLLVVMVLLSAREWILLLARRRLARLHETEPVWLPDYALAEGKRWRWLGLVALAVGLAKELTGEAAYERARLAPPGDQATACVNPALLEHGGAHLTPTTLPDRGRSAGAIFAEVQARRYRGPTRCC